MLKSSAKPLLMLISLTLLNGCSITRANNICPDPYFASCEAVCDAAKVSSPDSNWRDLKNMSVVMLQLRERQEEKEPFGKCVCK